MVLKRQIFELCIICKINRLEYFFQKEKDRKIKIERDINWALTQSREFEKVNHSLNNSFECKFEC